uniref:DNA-directed DNA polymerase n=1 Tax=Steinernema glaseri TaxID=37863 RepID=A0A1I7Y1S5_9BILA
MRRSRTRLVLEAVCSGLCQSLDELQRLFELSLYGSCESVEKEVASLARDLYIHQQLQSVEGSQLGRATLSSSLTPDVALFVYRDLKQAMRALSLDSELHMLYLVTPFNNSAIWSSYVDWNRFHALWLQLGPEAKRTAKSIGVEERFILMKVRGTFVDPGNPMLQIHLRFLSTMALLELIGERKLDDVAKEFGIARGLLQSLQQQAATYACMVVAFCDRLGWTYLKTLLDGFAERLAFGVRKDLTELVRIDGIDATRARAFHSAGINSASALALADPQNIVSVLRRSVPFSGTCSHGKNTWLAGEPPLSEKEAAGELIIRARVHIAENLRLMGLFSDSAIDGLMAKSQKKEEDPVKTDLGATAPPSGTPEGEEEAPENEEAVSVVEGDQKVKTDEDEEAFQSQFDDCPRADDDPEEAANGQEGQLDETLLDCDSLMLIPTQARPIDDLKTEEDSFLVDDSCLFSQLKSRNVQKHLEPIKEEPLTSRDSGFSSGASTDNVDSFLVDDCALFSQLKSDRNENILEPIKEEAYESHTCTESSCSMATVARTEGNDEEVDSFLADDSGLFSPLKLKNGLAPSNTVREEAAERNKENEKSKEDEMELSRSFSEISFVAKQETSEEPQKRKSMLNMNLSRIAIENSRRMSMNMSMDSTVSSVGFDRSVDMFSSPSPDHRKTKKRPRSFGIASPMASPTCRSPFSKVSKLGTPRSIESEVFAIEDVCQSMATWTSFVSEVLSWPRVGLALCFAEKDRSFVGISFCSPEGNPKFLTISESAVCGNAIEEDLYPSSTPLECISLREKVRFVLDLLESEKSKFFCDLLTTMRAIKSLNVCPPGGRPPKIRNSVCLRTVAFLMQIPPTERGGALWNLAKKYQWPPSLGFEGILQSGPRIRSAVLSFVASRIYARMETLLRRIPKASRDLELRSVELIAEMEWIGFRMNRQECQKMTSAVLAEMSSLESEGAKLAGCRFSFDSPKRIAEILFVKLGVPAPLSAAGKTHFATNASVLQQIQHPLAKVILRWRKLQNALTCSLRILQNAIKMDGRIHTCFDHLTPTGRVISSSPNVQNIPKEEALIGGRSLRSLFIAADGMILLAADFSQLELRVLAHLSRDPNLRAVLNLSTGDVFESMCAKWNADPKVETKVDRQKAKQLCYALIYGMGTTTLAEELRVSRKEAQDLVDSFFNQFPKVRAWIDDRVRVCRAKGFVDTMLGKQRPLADIASGIQKDRSRAERQAVNSTIQGTASEIFKLSLLKIRERLKEVDGRVVMQIHDEVIVEVPTKAKTEAATILRECMESSCPEFSVRLPVKIAAGGDWGTLKKL